MLVLLITGVVSGGILYFVYRIQPVAGCVVESIMTYQILAIRSLKVESMKVYDALQTGTIEDARQADPQTEDPAQNPPETRFHDTLS